ncbi:MAG: hypothetical protein GY940_05470 [bacterium]|nr:hypothetical protein [bacterium]
MSNCKNCGAALATGTIVCEYCGTRQDVDLHGVHRHTVEKPQSERICPRCDNPMQTIDLKIGGKFLIERCQECLGMFFDPGELEALLDKSVSNVYAVNYLKLDALKNAKRHDDFPVTYIKCPVCRKFMNRINFGSRSGVIVDNCKTDGIWLDGGELRQLMEWTKAGGALHNQKVDKENKKIEKEEETRKLREAAIQNARDGVQDPYSRGHGGFNSYGRGRFDEPEDLFTMLTGFVGRLFR